MELAEGISWLSSLARYGWKLDLNRIKALCELADHPERRLPCVHVTGTNGKGSTCHFLASILEKAGCSCGLFTSPHLLTIRERFQINGQMISEDELCARLERIRPLVNHVADLPCGQPTEFEVKTLLALQYFLDSQVDVAVIEVGLGGRFDSTNVISPYVSVVTNVSLDHTDRLGRTVREIARDKAGIIKPGVPVITASDDCDVLEVLRTVALENEARLLALSEGGGELGYVCVDHSPENASGEVWLGSRRVAFRLQMAGAFQVQNAALAAAAAMLLPKSLEISDKAICEGLGAVRLPGRLQSVVTADGQVVLLDAAHNRNAAQAIATHVASLVGVNEVQVCLGMSTGHSVKDVVTALGVMNPTFYLVRAQNPRAVNPYSIAEEARRWDCRVCGPVESGISEMLRNGRPGSLNLVTGSFYVLEEALRVLQSQQADLPRCGEAIRAI